MATEGTPQDLVATLQRENELLKQKLERAASNLSQTLIPEVGVVHPKEAPRTTQLNDRALSIVVIGASGDLAKKKTYPALFTLFKNDLLPDHAIIWGYARSEMSLEEFRKRISTSMKGTPEQIQAFLGRCFYCSGSYNSIEAFGNLASKMAETERANRGPAVNRIFYMAIPPSVFLDIATVIHAAAMTDSGFNRIVVEKPFGHDSASSAELTERLGMLFSEDQIYRIDHYLGKELVLNVLVLRFANLAFVPLWNRDHIANVTITFKEDILLEGRAGYFDKFGIIRDVMQNHLLQIFALIAMEPPIRLTAEYVRDEKVKVLRACRPITMDDVVVGQFEGYLDDQDVPKDSITPTFAAAVIHIHNQRWDGVPFILKCGKGLNERKTEVRIQFKPVPGQLFPTAQRNELVLRVQPDEAIYMKMMTKVPGLNDLEDLTQSEMDLTYRARYQSQSLPDAYERLILDVLRGDHTHFVRSDELSAAWDIFTPMLHQLERDRVKPVQYKVGARAPEEADTLSQRYGFVHSKAYNWQSPY